jgi:hypothetical protein
MPLQTSQPCGGACPRAFAVVRRSGQLLAEADTLPTRSCTAVSTAFASCCAIGRRDWCAWHRRAGSDREGRRTQPATARPAPWPTVVPGAPREDAEEARTSTCGSALRDEVPVLQVGPSGRRCTRRSGPRRRSACPGRCRRPTQTSRGRGRGMSRRCRAPAGCCRPSRRGAGRSRSPPTRTVPSRRIGVGRVRGPRPRSRLRRAPVPVFRNARRRGALPIILRRFLQVPFRRQNGHPRRMSLSASERSSTPG